MDGGSEDSLMVDNYARRWISEDVRSRCRRELITINMLPDDVLLEIFEDFCRIEVDELRVENWKTLVHVCRRWRSVVFQSPRCLNLRLLCTSRRRVRDALDVWPPLPFVICEFSIPDDDRESSRLDNIIAALEHNDRVCRIQLQNLTFSQLECVTDSPAMQRPFPELTDLRLAIDDDGPGPILPDSFLGGTAPRLRELSLGGVPFPGLPKLLLSATHLVKLSLYDIDSSENIPAEAMVTCLSALNSLKFLSLHFLSPQPRPALESRRPRPRPPTHSIPSLTEIRYDGASEYLEEILAGIDAPRLNKMFITFFDHITFDTPQLFQFASRSPTLRTPDKGYIVFDPLTISVTFSSQTSNYWRDDVLIVRIPCKKLGWQLSFLKHCTSSLPPVSTLKNLFLHDEDLLYGRQYWHDDVENTLWLELLHPFVAVKNLYLSADFVPRIAPALQELVGRRTTEVLPTLENIFLEGCRPSGALLEAIEKFVAARRLTNHPVAVLRWGPILHGHGDVLL